tara:strand:- start:1266 stop:1421 length:156 start_codon:yes stop_codon:yes gene_type:complete
MFDVSHHIRFNTFMGVINLTERREKRLFQKVKDLKNKARHEKIKRFLEVLK